MEIILGTIKTDESGHSVDFRDELTKEKYQTFLDAIAEIHELENNKRLFEITFLNKKDFVDAFNNNVKDMISSTWSLAGDREKYYKHHLNFNRLFLNYLSSVRSFLDHNETIIKRKFGSESSEAIEFKKICKYYFDNFFSYRFFYKLRNYSQHCGLPIKEFNISTQRKDDGSYFSESEMTFNSVELLKEFKWGADVTADLEKINGKFPLAPLIEEMTHVLLGFWQAVDQLNARNIDKAVKFIKDNTDHLRAINTDICIFTNIRDNSDKSLANFEKLTIPMDIVDDLT